MMTFFVVTALVSGVASLLLVRRRSISRLVAKPANFGIMGGFPVRIIVHAPTTLASWTQLLGRLRRTPVPMRVRLRARIARLRAWIASAIGEYRCARECENDYGEGVS